MMLFSLKHQQEKKRLTFLKSNGLTWCWWMCRCQGWMATRPPEPCWRKGKMRKSLSSRWLTLSKRQNISSHSVCKVTWQRILHFPKLCEAIRAVCDGGQFFADEIKEPRSSNKVKNISELRFSPQELKLIEHLAKGKSSEAIAEEMGLSRRTVEFYKQRAMEKARVQTSTELITFLYRNGLS